jgi:hypothetical protein
VLNYDRRGRGDSGDTAPYAVDREIAAAGGSAAVFGYSSGATLALKAAAHGLPVTKLVLYEPPFRTDDSHPGPPADLARRLAGLVAAGRRGDAVELYQIKAVGLPADVVAELRHAPFRPGLEAIAHTLAYDAAIIGDLSLPAGAARHGHHPGPGHQRRAEPAVPAGSKRGSRGGPAQRAAGQPPRPDP